MGLKEYLTEERLHSKDIRQLLNIFDKAEDRRAAKSDFVLKSFNNDYTDEEREVETIYSRGGVRLTYNADHFELTNTLIDLSDEKGYKFKTNTQKNINTTTFTVMV